MKIYGYHDNYANCDVQQDDLSYLIHLTKRARARVPVREGALPVREGALPVREGALPVREGALRGSRARAKQRLDKTQTRQDKKT